MTTSRREFLTFSAAALGVAATGLPTMTAAQNAPELDVFCRGGPGGGAFGPIYPTSVGLAQGRDSDNAVRVNYIKINGKEYGSRNVDEGQLEERATLRLGPDEYITNGTIRWGHRHPIYGKDRPILIDRLDLRTNKGKRTWTPGWSKFSQEEGFGDLRVCTIAGRAGARLDQVCFEVIRGYEPSEKVEPNVEAVFGYHLPSTKVTVADTETNRKLLAWERVVTRQRTRSFSQSVGVELLAGLVDIGTDVSLTEQNTTVTSVTDLLETTSQTVKTVEERTEEYHGFVVGRVDVYRDQEGNHYAVPTGAGTLYRYTDEMLPLLNGYLNFANNLDLLPNNALRVIPDPIFGGDITRILVT